MRNIIVGLLLALINAVGWSEDEEPLVLYCVYEATVGNGEGLLVATEEEVRNKETLKVSSEYVEEKLVSPIPIVQRSDALIVARYHSAAFDDLLFQKTYVFKKQGNQSYSVLRSFLWATVGYLDYGTCTKF
ncbi:MAG: hypothetical protein CBE03_004285 [Gammaproteobacteria bacterium TMED243]|nr:MAG: hypothetical protein CBE03_004285 [Gammaproteobacteria bacterium TMED243]